MASDYTKIGLGPNLFGTDTIVNPIKYTTSSQFDSNFEGLSAIKIPDSFKIVKEGTTSISGTDSYNDITNVQETHNLGYTPAFLAYVNSSNFFYPLPLVADNTAYNTSNVNGTQVIRSFRANLLTAYTTPSIINFFYNGQGIAANWSGAGAPWSYNIKYYLLREIAGSLS